MGRVVQCFLPFVPPKVTHNDLEAYVYWRNDKPVAGIRKSDRLKAAEDMMRPYVERLGRMAGGIPLKKCEQTVKICWPTGGRHEQGELCDEPPDYDNWVKAFNDICQDCGVIINDCYIAIAHVYKVWADPAGVFVRFREIT